MASELRQRLRKTRARHPRARRLREPRPASTSSATSTPWSARCCPRRRRGERRPRPLVARPRPLRPGAHRRPGPRARRRRSTDYQGVRVIAPTPTASKPMALGFVEPGRAWRWASADARAGRHRRQAQRPQRAVEHRPDAPGRRPRRQQRLGGGPLRRDGRSGRPARRACSRRCRRCRGSRRPAT